MLLAVHYTIKRLPVIAYFIIHTYSYNQSNFLYQCLRLVFSNFAWQPANRNDVTSDHAIAGRGPRRPTRPLQTDSGKRQSVRLAALACRLALLLKHKQDRGSRDSRKERCTLVGRAGESYPGVAGCFCLRNRESKGEGQSNPFNSTKYFANIARCLRVLTKFVKWMYL